MTVIDLPVPARTREADEAIGNRLARALGDRDARVRRAAADTLIDEREVLVGEEGVRALVQAADATADSYVREVARELVRAMRAAAWDIYALALRRDDAGRAETIRGLVVLKATAELGEIALTDPSWRIRERAVAALGELGPRTAVGPLTSVLDDEVVAVRRAAVQALARWAADRHYARSALTTALEDPDAGVRAEARWALAVAPSRP
ncbi:HEAT repeat domain-containing protein [Actinoallomurus purpureus]|uniref:HEAT repeat domain-containing protein n=1 Tax=Actinoallomurus purpureus TaxID=478114 RepID=UPI00209268F9|nr:HEAT repeat domain-containing protein [Actinoallomurus purpureus]MCO6011281.1 HEAT repeat domain-containing protein [Actinoallomurus purpureus]